MMTIFSRIIIALFVVCILVACDKIESAQTRNDFTDVMLDLQTNIQAKGYKVSRVQQVDVGMKKSGYTIAEYRVVFFARPDEVKTILEKYPEFASFLPLSITIYKDGDITRLAGMPFVLPRSGASTQDLKTMIETWEKDTADIIHQTAETSD